MTGMKSLYTPEFIQGLQEIRDAGLGPYETLMKNVTLVVDDFLVEAWRAGEFDPLREIGLPKMAALLESLR